MERVCFLLRVRADRLDEYKARHRAVWPEMREALTRRPAGATTRSSCATTACSSATWRPTTSRPLSAAMEATEVNARWQAEMAEFFELPSGERPDTGLGGSRRSSTLTEGPIYAAVDLGASSGRVVAGRRAGGRVVLRRSTASPTGPVRLPDGLHWNLPALFGDALDGLGAAAPAGRSRGDRRRRLGRGLRAARRRAGACSACRSTTATRAPRDGRRAPSSGCRADELYAVDRHPDAADQHRLPAARRGGHAALAAAERLAFVPDLLAYWLSGVLANESHIASTSGLLDARTGRWALGLVARLGLPERLFAEVVEPGERLGPLLAEHAAGLGLPGRPWSPSPAHDTASAFAAAPVDARRVGGPVERHLVAARDGAARAGAGGGGPRGQPHQRARRRRHDAAAEERHGPLARAGVPPVLGRGAVVRRPRAARRGAPRRGPPVRPRRPRLPAARATCRS